MIRCVIIDDERRAIEVIEFYINKIPALELIGTARNPVEGIEIIKLHKPDVVFLDIDMYEMSGMEVAKAIHGISKIVFCTAFSEFAVDSYDLDAVDFLIKPVGYERFEKAVQRVAKSLHIPFVAKSKVPKDYMFVKTESKGRMLKIDFNDIDYVEGLRNYVTFYCGNRKFIVHYTMKQVEELLPEEDFVRVHRSYISSIKKISEVQGGLIILKTTNFKIPISENYRNDFLGKISHDE